MGGLIVKRRRSNRNNARHLVALALALVLFLVPLVYLARSQQRNQADTCRQLRELRRQVQRDSLGWPVRQLPPVPLLCETDSLEVTTPGR
jgi:hypothetical protein